MRRLLGLWGLTLLMVAGGCSHVLGLRPRDPAARREIPPYTVAPPRAGTAYERFIVFGDMGTGRRDQRKVAAAMAQRAAQDGLDFMLTVGDNFYPRGVKSADDPQWSSKFEAVYADPALQVPVYASLGNHDHYGNPQAQVDYAAAHPNWRMPGYYYTFTRTLSDGTRVAFFAIDSNPIVQEQPEAEEQVAWLDRTLAQSDARWKIVFGHHPLYGHNPYRGRSQPLIARLEPLLVKYGVDVYFAGHDHTLEMMKPIQGVYYVISGAAGGPDMAYPVKWTDESFYAATLGGFTLCRVSEDELLIEFVRLDGRTQYAHTLEK